MAHVEHTPAQSPKAAAELALLGPCSLTRHHNTFLLSAATEALLHLQTRLDAADTAVRTEKAQQPKKFVASGGLTGFRVASDLYKMDLSYVDDYKDPDAWRAEPKPKK